ncbi:MAG: subtilisin family serine protease [Gammaproteobacteria bacterium]|jgi:subtilisin family serine protease
MHNLSYLKAGIALGLIATASAPALFAQDREQLPTSPPTFVAKAGQLEFRGVLVARPLQISNAAQFGLAPTEASELASQANDLLSKFELERYEFRTDESFIKVPAGSSEQEVAQTLLASGAFEYVEPDWTAYPVGCPNDSGFNQQWHHAANLMNSCAGWDINLGDPSVVVAICDTGLRTSHEDIQLFRQEGYNAEDQIWENSGGDISPVHPHGTMTTGCAAANGNNGVGISGVGWNLGHRMMRVSNVSTGGASIGTLTHAAMVAADQGDRVASVSYSGVTSAGVDTAGQYCRSRDALLVWAAGNDSANLGGSRDDNVIVVGATDINDSLAGFSAFGSFVDLVAPGVSVYTMNSGSDSDYASVSGTSFSCPLTAGLCALIWSLNPALTPQQVEDYLRASCKDLGAAGVDNQFGYGRIEVEAALLLANSPIFVGFPNGLPEFVDPAGGTSLEVSVENGSSSIISNSGILHVDSGSGFTSHPMTETVPGSHLGIFPAATCGNTVQWYVDFALTGGGTQSSPDGAPGSTYAAIATVVTTVYSNNVESSAGWTGGVAGDNADTGQWTHGNPLGTVAQPEDDDTEMGTNCWFTGQGTAGGSSGENDVDGGSTTLLSPILDASGLADPTITYSRWYSNDSGAAPNADIFEISVSNDGGQNWTPVETLGPNGPGTSGGWIQYSFQVTSLLAASNNMQLQFVASDLGSASIIEAAIDELSITDSNCAAGCGALVNYCQTSPNSVGPGALISSLGMASIAANNLVLRSEGAPANQSGIFFYGNAQTNQVFGNGFQCAGGAIVRLGFSPSDLLGMSSTAIDITNLPNGGVIQAGDTVNFQYWYRDNAAGGAQFNLSDGLTATFCP